MPDRDDIITILKSMLGEKRLYHSICVEERAAVLAEIYGGDREKAALAGLIHDIYHDKPKDEQLKYIRSRGILLDNFTAEHPALWHAVCGAEYIKEIGIDDPDIITAVRYHTTGKKCMSLLDKIVYLADATSADRNYPGAAEMRETADRSLDEAMLKSLKRELEKLIANGKTITADAWEAYNDFAYGITALNIDELRISAMTKEYAALISKWRYDGIYSFYDHNEDNTGGYMDGAHFACVSATGDLIGYYCFGENARIPTVEDNVYGDGFLDIGLGLRPDLCGKSLGLLFIKKGLKYAGDFYSTKNFRLSVAAFNERAIKVYRRAGFYMEKEVTNSYFKNKFLIMSLKDK